MDMFKEYGITLEEAENFIDTIAKIVEYNTEYDERWKYIHCLDDIKIFLQENFKK